MPKRIIYHPPSRRIIDEFVQQVSNRLSREQNPGYSSPDVIWGLARFLELAGSVLAKRLSEQNHNENQNLDSDPK